MRCELCNKDIFVNHFKLHLSRVHGISAYDYYKGYIDKEFHKCKNPVCSNEARFISLTNGFRDYCSKSCANTVSTSIRHETEPCFGKEKGEATKLLKYGNKCNLQSSACKEKIRQTCIDKYGVSHHMQSIECIEKSKATRYNKNGGSYFSDVSMQKMRDTNIERYGVGNVFQSEDVKNKIKTSNLERYGKLNAAMTDEVKHKISMSNRINYYNRIKDEYNEVVSISTNGLVCYCRECDKTYEIPSHLFYMRKFYNINPCIVCNNGTASGREIELYNYVKSLIECERGNRNILKAGELDIYVPSKRLAFEFDGLYWHNELNKENNYHINKTVECESLSVQLIHIFEDEWVYKQDIVKSRIRGLLDQNKRIFARKCKICQCGNAECTEFLNKNHIEGSCNFDYCYGLLYNSEVVAVMTFVNNNGKYEINRFCSKLNTNVIGGASKLFDYFTKTNVSVTKVIGTADRRWCNGNMYRKLNFKEQTVTCPNYYYVNGDKRYSNKQIIDSANNKLHKIYDCGNINFEWNRI